METAIILSAILASLSRASLETGIKTIWTSAGRHCRKVHVGRCWHRLMCRRLSWSSYCLCQLKVDCIQNVSWGLFQQGAWIHPHGRRLNFNQTPSGSPITEVWLAKHPLPPRMDCDQIVLRTLMKQLKYPP